MAALNVAQPLRQGRQKLWRKRTQQPLGISSESRQKANQGASDAEAG